MTGDVPVQLVRGQLYWREMWQCDRWSMKDGLSQCHLSVRLSQLLEPLCLMSIHLSN